MTPDVTSADAVIAAIEPQLAPPEVQARDVVLVTGPSLAGSAGMAAALRDRMPERTFVEADELGQGEAPAAVVFVVSAVAPLTESDCILLDSVTENTDLVIGVVSKIDTHRDWRDVLAADRAVLAARSPRYARSTWVGAAAAPDLGEPRVDELVNLLRRRLVDPQLWPRNRLRAWETRLESAIDRHRCEGDGLDRRARVAALQQARDDVVRDRRQSKSERTTALRSGLQQARVQFGFFVRNRCTSVRTELADDVSQLRRGKLRGFEPQVRERVTALIAEVEDRVTGGLADMAAQLDLPAPPASAAPVAPVIAASPLKSRRLERQSTVVLGAGFGLGVSLAVTRLLAGMQIAGLVVGGLVGLALTMWVVGLRGLLHDRAVLDRWVAEVTSAARAGLEERVTTRIVAAESALTSQWAVRDEHEALLAQTRITEIEAELHEHAVQTARAAVVRDRRLPSLQRALDAVRNELDRSNSAEMAI